LLMRDSLRSYDSKGFLEETDCFGKGGSLNDKAALQI